MTKSLFLMKLDKVDQLMGLVHQAQYFKAEALTMGMAGTPKVKIYTKKLTFLCQGERFSTFHHLNFGKNGVF